jgi:putative ABC transport system permease protein
MLLSGAALMLRSFVNLGSVDGGFDPRGVLSMRVILAGSPHGANPGTRNAFYRTMLDRVATIPGIESVSAINHLPLAGDLWTFGFQVEGRPTPPPQDAPTAAFRVAFPNYFRAMRIPLVAGRDLDARDDGAVPPVVVVNQTMARKMWPHEEALGKRIRLSSSGPWFQVVGVVKDVEQREWGAAADNEFYFPQLQNPEDIQRSITLVLRTAGDPLAVAGAVQGQIWSLDRDVPVEDVASMQQVVARAEWQPRFSTTLLGGFAGLALVLAAIGIYGVMSFDVSRRVQEIGIRMALGAKPVDVMLSVLGGGGRLAALGTALGIAGSLALTRYLQSLLYQVSTTDPIALAGAAGVLGFVALAALWAPARRATRVDPVEALRSE